MNMIVSVCIGSSCHLKGSYDVIKKLEDLIASHDLESKVTLKGAFCLGRCTEGVSCLIDEEYNSLSMDNVIEIFNEKILGSVK
jgi:NADH:ubiquinone oxidoreductase subunit E